MKYNELLQEGGPAGASVLCRTKARHRILVVDEDRDLRQLYADVLARPDYHVDAVEDGATGWEALQANNYNLLITEHSLPKLTGLELVRKLRGARMALPVVMAALRLPAQDLALDPALQLAAVLPKPFYISQLLETVRTALGADGSLCERTDPPPSWRSWPSPARLRV